MVQNVGEKGGGSPRRGSSFIAAFQQDLCDCLNMVVAESGDSLFRATAAAPES